MSTYALREWNFGAFRPNLHLENIVKISRYVASNWNIVKISCVSKKSISLRGGCDHPGRLGFPNNSKWRAQVFCRGRYCWHTLCFRWLDSNWVRSNTSLFSEKCRRWAQSHWWSVWPLAEVVAPGTGAKVAVSRETLSAKSRSKKEMQQLRMWVLLCRSWRSATGCMYNSGSPSCSWFAKVGRVWQVCGAEPPVPEALWLWLWKRRSNTLTQFGVEPLWQFWVSDSKDIGEEIQHKC